MKRLALFLDGTWNEPEDNTNVWRLHTLLAETGDDGARQVGYYDTGVGTRWYDKIRGGALGTGLTAKVRVAYEWLVRNYDDGDELFVFGFSRGAFTARSLCAVIAHCGLLLPGASTSVGEVFEHYEARNRSTMPEARRIPVDFIGVFDTVGALGIPGISAKRHRFHNPHPSVSFKAMYQAVAIDENRREYSATLWTRWALGDHEPDALKPDQVLEQRWFIGDHRNVGGGQRHDDLPTIPLAWMQQRASAHGLGWRRAIAPAHDAHRDEVHDSFAAFMGGLYRIVRLGRRHWRPIGAEPADAPLEASGRHGRSHALNQVIDASVIRRYRQDPSYRPPNLIDWATRAGVDLDTATGDRAAGTWVSERPC